MNTEERQPSDMLRRVTPEPPRRVTVEDVAFRLANQAGPGHREPRARRGLVGWNRSSTPVLAAASVFRGGRGQRGHRRRPDLAPRSFVATLSFGASDIGSSAGNLVATSGGVWGTVGVGMAERVWFAPGANLTQIVLVSQGAGAGLDSVPTFSGGTVWIGGSHTLVCASPATGQVLASTTIPTDAGVVEYFGSVTVTDGRAYAYYQNQRAQQFGVATITPPNTCSG